LSVTLRYERPSRSPTSTRRPERGIEELARRLAGTTVEALAVHPGAAGARLWAASERLTGITFAI